MPRRRHDLHHQSRGEPGRPIVFCHGVTLSSRVWAKQFESLPAAGFRAVAFDHRGHGESTRRRDRPLARQPRRRPAHACSRRSTCTTRCSSGTRWAAIAVQAFAIRHPEVVDERVRGLVLLSTSSHNLVSDATRVRGAVEQSSTSGPTSARSCGIATSGLLLARIGFGDDPHPSHVEATAQMLAACARGDAPAKRSPRCSHLDLTEGLPKVHVPTLVIVGTADVLTPPRDARRIAELIPGARLGEYPGGGHMLMLERTDELDALIIDFARAMSGGRRAGRRRAAVGTRG